MLVGNAAFPCLSRHLVSWGWGSPAANPPLLQCLAAESHVPSPLRASAQRKVVAGCISTKARLVSQEPCWTLPWKVKGCFCCWLTMFFFTVQQAEWALGCGCGWEPAFPSCARRAVVWWCLSVAGVLWGKASDQDQSQRKFSSLGFPSVVTVMDTSAQSQLQPG